MASPFPGMDPYLEAPDIWPDFHDAFASAIREALNTDLPAPFYARLEMRPEIGIVDDEGYQRRIVPDIAVVRRPRAPAEEGGVAIQDAPRAAVSRSIEVSIPNESLRHLFVEIRDPTRSHKLVTLIEIVSPSNKHSGDDRRSYLHKQKELLQSDASLIELDLLREGERLIASGHLREFLSRLEPVPDYLVLVNRSWRRIDPSSAYQIFPVMLTELLPVIAVPLRQDLDEVPLDLEFAFNRAYDSGPYRRGLVDYSQPPRPPLPGEKATWSEQLLRSRGVPAT